MSSGGPFSRPVLALTVAIGAASLLAGFAAAIFGGEFREVQSTGANAFSRSAVGHHAFVELLRRSGREVIVGRRVDPGELGPDAVLFLLEPVEGSGWSEHEAERLRAAIENAPRALVALPKWEGFAGPARPEHLAHMDLRELESPSGVLEALGVDRAEVERLEEPVSGWVDEGFAAEPELARPQLVSSPGLESWIRHRDRVLVGRLSGPGLRVVLTDPDLISNHGIGRGRNAELALELVARVAGPDATIVVDETLHGLGVRPKVWTELGRFPLVLVVAQAVLATAFLLWAATRRFGEPLPERRGLGAGKRLLIENTAELLRSGGHSASMLRRYVEYNVRRVADAYHLPPGLTAAERRARLEDVRRRAGGTVELAIVDEGVRAARAGDGDGAAGMVRTARLAREWREEMLHGAG